MPDILSQSQIDDLLKGLSSGSVDADEASLVASSKKVKEYDFKSPKKFTKEQLKTISSIHENFARLFSSYLTSILRVYCQVTVSSIDEERYYEFNNALPDSVLIGVVDLLFADEEIAESQIFVEISRPVSFGIMDRLLGGSGDGVDYERDYTDIEFSLLDNLFRQFIPLIRDSWSTYYDLKVTYNHLETNSRLIQSIRPDEIVVIVVMDIALKSLKGTISICIPAITLENLFKKTTKQVSRSKREASGDDVRKEMILKCIKDSSLEITAVLGDAEVTLRDIVEMQVGDVVMLERPVNSDVAIKVGSSTWFYGKAGHHKNKKAIKVTTVL